MQTVNHVYALMCQRCLCPVPTAVRAAYGMKEKDDILAFLLKLNLELAEKESKNESITPPGVPKNYPDPQKLVTGDCIRPGARG